MAASFANVDMATAIATETGTGTVTGTVMATKTTARVTRATTMAMRVTATRMTATWAMTVAEMTANGNKDSAILPAKARAATMTIIG